MEGSLQLNTAAKMGVPAIFDKSFYTAFKRFNGEKEQVC